MQTTQQSWLLHPFRAGPPESGGREGQTEDRHTGWTHKTREHQRKWQYSQSQLGVRREVLDVLVPRGHLSTLCSPGLLRASNPARSVQGALPAGGPGSGSERCGCLPTKDSLRQPAPPVVRHGVLAPPPLPASCGAKAPACAVTRARSSHRSCPLPPDLPHPREAGQCQKTSCLELKCAGFPKEKEMSHRKYYKKGLNLSAVQTL